MNRMTISEAQILRARADPRFKQILLAKSLEQLLGSMHRMQRSPASLGPDGARHLREGALMAVQLADRLRALDEKLGPLAQPRRDKTRQDA
jgi:hypothetical protein